MVHKTIKIWDDKEYFGADSNYIPKLDTYVLKDSDESKGAVLILPGGGYAGCSWREAEPVAVWANSCNYHAFVLYYSVAPNRHPQPLLDVTRAMCIIRDNAKEWNVDPEKIAVCGFSAGGHLAASIGNLWDAPYLQEIKNMDKGKNKPNALILGYPVITGKEKSHGGSFKNLLGDNASQELIDELSLENKVSEKTPPTFLWSTFDDMAVPVENTLLFASALRKNNIPFELHIFPEGNHGLSLATKQTYDGNPRFIKPEVSVWTKLCKQWLEGIF